ncbi:MAG TPA: hypothetical protein VF452_07225 [Candidatus Binatia bacterium]
MNTTSSNTRWSVLAGSALFVAGCMLARDYDHYIIGDYGYLEVRPAESHMNGFVVGVPHGIAEQDAIDYATTVSDATGARIIIAYGFKTKGIAVAHPSIHDSLIASGYVPSRHSESIYSDFTNFLQASAVGPLRFYVGFRTAQSAVPSTRIELLSGGFSFEQLLALKKSFTMIEAEYLKTQSFPRIEVAINRLDAISGDAFAVKNHGVLMLAEKGLVLQLPDALTQSPYKSIYREVIQHWLRQASDLKNARLLALTQPKIKLTRYGRIELIPARGDLRGVVIAAPHGSFDWYTAELVEELSYRTFLPSVVTRGFTPIECDGWRIDVNRPTERRYPADTIERTTDRSTNIYQKFRETVLAAARGPLDLYIEMHQNSIEDDIVVATLGITQAEASLIKWNYRLIRDRAISATSPIPRVNLLIEPLDQVPIGAWAAKDRGILPLAKKSAHFELPAHRVLGKELPRQVYTAILVELVKSITKAHSDKQWQRGNRADRYSPLTESRE